MVNGMKVLSYYENKRVKLGIKTEDGIIDVQAVSEKTGIAAHKTFGHYGSWAFIG
jgi:hypothetical protein